MLSTKTITQTTHIMKNVNLFLFLFYFAIFLTILTLRGLSNSCKSFTEPR